MACIKVTAYAKYMHDPLMIIIEQRPWLVLPTLNLAYERRGDIEKLNIVWSAFLRTRVKEPGLIVLKNLRIPIFKDY